MKKVEPVPAAPDALVIEAGSVLMTEYGEMVVESIYESSNGGWGGVTIYCEKPHTPAPVIEMDESWLFKWATCYAWEGSSDRWVQFETPPTPDEDCESYSRNGGKTSFINPEHAPTLPPGMRWQDTLTFVKERGGRDG